MLPVCSATTCCSNYSQILLYDGLWNLSGSHKGLKVVCSMGGKTFSAFPCGVHAPGLFAKTQATKSLCSVNVQSSKLGGYMDTINISLYPNELDNLDSRAQSNWYSLIGDNKWSGKDYVKYVEDAVSSVSEEQMTTLSDKLTEGGGILMEPGVQDSPSTLDSLPDSSAISPDSLSSDMSSSSTSPADFQNFLSDTNESVVDSLSKKADALNSLVDEIRSSINDIVKGANEAIDSTVTRLSSSTGEASDVARDSLNNLSSDLEKGATAAGFRAIDLLRQTIVVVEDSIIKGAKLISYSYGSIKELLPSDVQRALIISEDSAKDFSQPVGAAFQQVFTAIEGLERRLGLDPSDPIIPFILILGSSSALWAIYWTITYSGYAGDLSPKSAFELLSGEKKTVLIDVRPEVMRERDGVPDLRRAVRFRYASVSLPEVDGSVQKLLKGGRDVYDTLTAVIIRNLKNVRDDSSIIIMDADGTRSKGIARSLRKLRMRKPYIVEGGFDAWVKEGLRIKELKPETALAIINEDAEAILDDLKLSPLQYLGICLGSAAALYALLEWEKTLQFIGLVGIGQTIYWRVSSYEDSEDLQEDLRLLLSPVQFGTQAVSWAAGKLETNGISLPMSPSSPDVQSRVLQAAAKHESQPSDEMEGNDQNSVSDSENNPLGDTVA